MTSVNHSDTPTMAMASQSSKTTLSHRINLPYDFSQVVPKDPTTPSPTNFHSASFALNFGRVTDDTVAGTAQLALAGMTLFLARQISDASDLDIAVTTIDEIEQANAERLLNDGGISTSVAHMHVDPDASLADIWISVESTLSSLQLLPDNEVPSTQMQILVSNAGSIDKALRRMNTESCDVGLVLTTPADRKPSQITVLLNPVLFKPETANIYCRQFCLLAEKLIWSRSGKGIPASSVRTLCDASEKAFLTEYNNMSSVSTADPILLHQMFENAVERYPTRAALVFGNDTVTYQNANVQSNQLAHYLRKEASVQLGDTIGLFLHRSTRIPISILAILKAGAVFVPLDVDAPLDRLKHMVADANIKIIISDAPLVHDLGSHVLVVAWQVQEASLETRIASQNTNDISPASIGLTTSHEAYILFTSGTSGKPKAARLEHRGASNAICNILLPALGDFHRYLAFAQYTFDVSIADLFVPFVHGATLVMARKEDILSNLGELVTKHAIDAIGLTPRALSLMDPVAAAKTLKTIWIIGEPYSPPLVQKWLDAGVVVINAYGPTETAILTSTVNLHEDTFYNNIGHPGPHVKYYILDEFLQPLPVGVTGELYIGGIQVGRGYLNRPDINEKTFLRNPFELDASEAEGRLYRTGDLARFHACGSIEYRGRADQQFKLRGLRIEGKEVEAVLLSYPAVKEAVVVLREDQPGNQMLVAYIVTITSSWDSDTLRAHCAGSLSPYMIPAAFVPMSKIPLTSSGKTDQRALPPPRVAVADCKDIMLPSNETEDSLLQLWSKILGIPADGFGIDDTFFELAGDSLKAAHMVGQLNSKYPGSKIAVCTIFNFPTIRQLAIRLADASGDGHQQNLPPVPIPSPETLPKIKRRLAFAEETLWNMWNDMPTDDSLNLAEWYTFPPTTDQTMLSGAISKLVQRHESLRTTYSEVDGTPYATVHAFDETHMSIRHASFSAESIPEVIPSVEDYVEKMRLETMDLVNGPCVKFATVKTLHGIVLIMIVHHICADGWSLRVIEKDLRSFLDGSQSTVPQATPFSVFANWETLLDRTNGEYQNQQKYWSNKLVDVRAAPLPSDFAHGGHVHKPVKATVTHQFSAETSQLLAHFAKNMDASTFMIILGALNLTVSRWTGREDVCLGSLAANRSSPEFEFTTGFFVNSLALRTQIEDGKDFEDIVRATRNTCLEAYDNQLVPFAKVVKAVEPERSPGRHPMFQILLIDQSHTNSSSQLAADKGSLGSDSCFGIDATLQPFEIIFEYTKDRETGQILWQVKYDSQLYLRETVIALLDQVGDVLKSTDPSAGSVTESPTTQSVINLSSIEDSGDNRLLHHIFERTAAENPELPAIVYKNVTLTYGEVNDQANRLARYIKSLGLDTEDLIGLSLSRSHLVAISILAIWKAGCAYVPFDTTAPQERLRHMLKDTAVKFIITQDSEIYHFESEDPNLVLLNWDEREFQDHLLCQNGHNIMSEETPRLNETSLAYCLFTSGTTGLPKATLLEHRSTWNFAKTLLPMYFSEVCNYLGFFQYTFDVSIADLLIPFSFGGTLHVLSKDDLLLDVNEYIVRNRIDTMAITPSALSLLDASRVARCLQRVHMSGEGYVRSIVRPFLEQGIKIVNAYGPTECAIDSSATLLQLDTFTNNIGIPFRNVAYYVLDDQLNPVPIGVPGELYIAGVQVGRGYLNREELTNATILPNPFSNGRDGFERMYRTGDLVRRHANCDIEHLSRVDGQVKLRGYRIELGEIEAVLSSHPMVVSAAVQLRAATSKDAQLVAFVVLSPGCSASEAFLEELQQFGAQSLLSYMAPNVIIKIDALPLTPNGKVDKIKLGAVSVSAARRKPDLAAIAAPVSETEKLVTEIWKKILDVEDFDIHVSVFRLGVNSLLAAQLVSCLNKRIKRRVRVIDVFAYGTVSSFARYIDLLQRNDESEKTNACEGTVNPLAFELLNLRELLEISALDLRSAQISLAQVEDIYPATPMQRNLVAATFGDENAATSYLSQMVYEFAREPDLPLFQKAWEVVVRKSPILRTRFLISKNQSERLACLQVVMRYRSTADLKCKVLEVKGDAEFETLLQKDMQQGIELGKPCVRMTLIKSEGRRARFLFTIHHALFDGVSLNMILQDLESAYRDIEPPSRPSFAGFVKHISAESQSRTSDFWKSQLRDFAGMQYPILPSATYKPTCTGKLVKPLGLESRIAGAAQRLEVTESAIYKAAWALVLAAHANVDDIAFGCLSAGRGVSVDGIESMNGPCITKAPFRITIDQNQTAAQFIHSVHKQSVELMEHEHCSVADILRCAPQVTNAYGLFATTLVIQGSKSNAWHSITSEFIGVRDQQTMDMALCLEIVPTGSGLQTIYQYDANVLDEGEVEWIAQHFQSGVLYMIEEHSSKLNLNRLANPQEIALLESQWKRDIPSVDPLLCIHHMFESQVQRTPSKIAVEHLNGQKWTYAELDKLSNKVACHLQADHGVTHDVLVPICIGKTMDMVPLVLGVLKAGGAFVPVDPSWPRARINAVLRQTRSNFVLTVSEWAGSLSDQLELPLVVLDTDKFMADESKLNAVFGKPNKNKGSGDNLAYAIFTSGSTGEPKGCLIPHRALVCARTSFCERTLHDDTDRHLNFATFTFDTCATLCMATKDDLSSDLEGVIARMQVTFLALTPSVLALVRPEKVPSVRKMDCGGEPISRTVVERWGDVAHMQNGYGPSETCCLSHSHRVHSKERNINLIGFPFSHVLQFILDDELSLVPVGVVGELCLGGSQLGLGYLDNPELTAKAWVDHPKYGLIYRTGDSAKFWHDGKVMILGRRDNQIKIHGQRIECGEIESVLSHDSRVGSLCVMPLTLQGEREPSLVCFYGLKNQEQDNAHARDAIDAELLSLAEISLPFYMVPSVWVYRPRMPLNPSGKIDRKALKQMQIHRQLETPTILRTELSQTEKVLMTLLGSIIGQGRTFTVEDSWLKMGLNSLSTIRFVGLLRQKFESEVKISTLRSCVNVCQLAQYLEQSITMAHSPDLHEPGPAARGSEQLTRQPRVGRFPASSAQKRMWMAQQKHMDGTYNVFELKRVRSLLDPDALLKAMQIICERHAVFRTTFEAGDQLYQVVHASLTSTFAYADLSSGPDPMLTLQKTCTQDAAHVFDLEKEMPVRLTVFKLGTNDFAIFLNMHHSVADAWTLNAVLYELSNIYLNIVGDKPLSLEPIDSDYVDFALQHNSYLQTHEAEMLSFWDDKLKNIQEAKFPLSAHEMATGAHSTVEKTFALSTPAVAAFHSLCDKENVSYFVGWLSLFQILLFRYANAAEFAVLCPVTDRGLMASLEDVLGCCTNTLPLICRIDAQEKFESFVHRNYHEVNNMLSQSVPFENIVRGVFKGSAATRLEELQMCFSYASQEYDTETENSIFKTSESIQIAPPGSGHFQMSFRMTQGASIGDMTLQVSYQSQAYSSEFIAQVVKNFEQLVIAVCEDSDSSVGALNILSDEERAVLSCSRPWENTSDTYHGLFEEQCQKSPNKIALEHLDGSRISYSELNQRANQVAKFLRQENYPPETRIPFCLEKSFDAVWWMIGIMKAGCCWIPLDPAPELSERNNAMMAALDAPFVVTNRALSSRFTNKGFRTLEVESMEETLALLDGNYTNAEVGIDALAYIFTTSGTTGTPKGILCEHKMAVNHYRFLSEMYGLDHKIRSLNFASYTFDITLTDIFHTLFAGGTVCVASTDIMRSQLADVVRALSVNFLKLTPSVIALLSPEEVPSVIKLVAGGEPITQTLIKTWAGITLFNSYGPTEVHCPISHKESLSSSPAILGREDSTNRCYILDERMQPVPYGVVGQLAVSGGQLARGYLNNSLLTSEKFVDNPFIPGTRMYLTGDLIRRRRDGLFEYFGRADCQVKLNGRRTELGEIEHAILQLPGVHNVCVALHSSVGLVAWITFRDDTTSSKIVKTPSDITSALSKRLPGYMLPKMVIPMTQLPVTVSGKVDRTLLLKNVTTPTSLPDSPPSKHPIELMASPILREIRKILGQPVLAMDDDLFFHGLDSYKAMRLIAYLRKAHHANISYGDLSNARSTSAILKSIGPHETHEASDVVGSDKAAVEATVLGLFRSNFPDIIWTLKDDFASRLTMKAVNRLVQALKNGFKSEMEIVDRDIHHCDSIGDICALLCKPQPPQTPESSAVPSTADLQNYPASYAQERMWAAHCLHDSSAYHVTFLRLTKPLDCSLLIKTMQHICEDHQILRTTYKLNSDCSTLLQEVQSPAGIDFECMDLSSDSQAETTMRRMCTEDNERVFDLSQEIPIRFKVFKLPAHTGIYLNIHHISVDEISTALLWSELSSRYLDALKGVRTLPRTSPPQYIAASRMHRTMLEASEKKLWNEQSRFWGRYLEDLPEIKLPELAASTGQAHATWSRQVLLEPEVQKTFLALCSKIGITPFMGFFAVYQVTLARYTGSKDFGIVTPVTLRGRVADGFQTLGCFLNTVLVRVQSGEDDEMFDILRNTAQNIEKVLRHIDIPFEEVLTSSDIAVASLQVYFDFISNTLSSDTQDLFADAAEIELEENNSPHFAFTLKVDYNADEQSGICIQYDSNKFDMEFVDLFLDNFQMVLKLMAAEPGRALSSIHLLSIGPMNQIVSGRPIANGITLDLPFDQIHLGFLATVARAPEAIAIQCGTRKMTYAVMYEKANILAHRLRKLDVVPGVFVGVVAGRSFEYYVALLAIQIAGGICVPIASNLPAQRIDYMLAKAQPKVLLYTKRSELVIASLNGYIPCMQRIEDILESESGACGANLETLSTADSVAYCIFTSGSTGQPKGVLLRQKGIVNNILGHPFTTHCRPGVRVGQFLAISFDGALQEIYGTWFTGATLIFHEDSVFEMLKAVDCINITPTGLLELEPSEFPNLKVILAVGETCPESLIHKWGQSSTFYVDYGATETSVTSSCTLPLKSGMQITLGTVFPNTCYYVLDELLKPVTEGMEGQLYTTGLGVSAGYLNDPVLTAKKFVQNPFASIPQTMYASGDIVRLLPSGDLQFVRRIDEQRKVGGYRVDLSEITGVALSFPQVRSAATIVYDNKLVTFVSPSSVATSLLQKAMARTLPHYMIPARVITIDTIPMTPNGKTDTRSLEAELTSRECREPANLEANPMAPVDVTQQKLAQLWSAILRIESAQIHPQSTFFELGGNSMNATKLMASIQRLFGVKLKMEVIFKHTSLEAMSLVIRNGSDVVVKKENPSPSFHALKKEKKKVLCLHGQGSNKLHLRQQLREIIHLLQNDVDFVFTQASFPKDNPDLTKFYDMDWYEWFSTDKSPPSLHLQKSVDLIQKTIQNLGGIDGILGFSQGAAMIELMDNLSHQGIIERYWGSSILFSGSPMTEFLNPGGTTDPDQIVEAGTDKNVPLKRKSMRLAIASFLQRKKKAVQRFFKSTNKKPNSVSPSEAELATTTDAYSYKSEALLDYPSLHIFDPAIELATCSAMERRYAAHSKILHDSGHDIPKDSTSCQKIAEAIKTLVV
ncbi:hypothetical protein DFS34DRAFT_654777 [Phlyctochytrium arcticum]|nr:hypothetical protein DFS34DRAFT_654777 [Phlyctochytrium arcticum]